MTQPTEAVEGGNEPAAELSIEDRLGALTEDNIPEEEEGAAEEPEEGEAEEPELTEEDVAEEEAETPPIAAPVSWTAEEKEAFKALPRELQETLTRREAEREKFVHSKAQEAKTARIDAEREALAAVQQIKASHIEAMEALLPAIPQRPGYLLQVEDPYAFAEQMEAYDRAVAQHNYVQQQIQTAQQHVWGAQQRADALDAEAMKAVLEDQFPDYLDPAKQADFNQKFGTTALALGYSAEQMKNVDANDILAMRVATDWREKAAKFDALMAKKMEGVREAKNMPKVSRPGTAQGKGTQENQRYAADRQAMKSGDRDAMSRVFERFV